MAKDFKAKQLRTTQIIASGSSVGSVPSLLIYSSSAASDVDGNYSAAMTTNVGTDVWMFVSGAKNDSGIVNDSHSGKVLFAGDVVVSGTLYAEKQILEVDLSQNSDLFLSGAVILGDQGSAPNGQGQARLYQTIGNNSGSIFVSTGSVYLAAKSSGNYTETEITPKIYQADNGLGSQVISSTNTSFHLDIQGLSSSLGSGDIAGTDLFAVADVGGTNEVKKITLTDVATKLAGDGIAAATGVLSATARNGVNVSSSGIEISLTDVSGSSAIATGDSIPFLDTDGSTQVSTVANLVTALAGDGIANSGNQFVADVDDVTTAIAGGKITVKSAGITGTHLNTSVAGNGLAGGGGSALSLDLNELSAAVVAVGSDSIAIIDADDNSSKKESIADLVGQIAGTASSTGISAASGVLSIDINALSADANAGNLADSIAISDNSDSNNNKKITLTQLKALVDTNTTYTAGDGLDLGGTEFSLDLKSSGGLKITSTELEVEPNDFAGAGLEDDGSDNLRIAASAAGVGITGGGGSALAIDTNVVQKIIYAVTGSGTHGFGTADAPAASNTDSLALGRRATASGNYSVAIGASQSSNNNTASGLSAAALGGDNATASGDYSAVLGGSGNTASGNYSAVLGRSSTAAGENSIAIGKSLTATEADSVAIGNSSNNAKIALSGSVEVFSTTVFNDDVSILGGGDLLVNTFIKHYGDTDTRIHFTTNEIKTTAGGANNVVVKSDQVLLLADSYSGQDVAFYVSGSTSSQGTTTKGTTLLDGDVYISGSLRGPSELQFDDSSTRIFRDGTVLKFDDASNDVKTLSQLASTGATTEHFVGVHGGSPSTSKLKTTASVAFAGASDNFVDGLAAEGVGADTFVFFSGSIGSRGTTTRGVTLFGGDSVFSGSATYLGTTTFSSLTATGDVTAGGSFVANGNTVKNSNGDKVFKFSSGTGAALMGDGSIIDSTTPSAFLHIENAENVQAAATNETANFNILLRNSTVQTNAFAGIAFDVSTELDADSIGAAIRAERDTSAGTTAANHATNLTFATNNVGDDTLTERMRITHDGKVGIGVEPGYALDVSGDIRVRGGDIRDMSGNVAISFDGSANTTVENILVIGGVISGSADTDLFIKSDGNMTFEIDADNDEGSQSFIFRNNGSSDLFEITDGGDINVAGDVIVGGDDIKDSGGNIAISFDGSGNIDNNVDFSGTIDFEGTVNVAQHLQHLGDTDTRLVFNDDQLSIQVGGLGFMDFTENDSQDTIVFNEGSNDIDFRIESNLETHMFFVDANTNRIGMGISGPAATLEIKGATADETTVLLRDSNSSDIIAKLYHENGEDDGILDLYANGSVTARLNSNGDSFLSILQINGNKIKDAGSNVIIESDGSGNPHFSGSADKIVATSTSTDANHFITFVDSSGTAESVYIDSSLSYNPSSNALSVNTITDGGAIDITSTGGDITIAAGGNQIYFTDNSSTRYTFNVDSTPELDVVGDFTIDGSGDVVIDGADDVIIKNNGTQRIQVEDATGDVAIGTHDPSYRLDVQDSGTSFVGNFETTSTSTAADILRLKIGRTGTLSTGNSFIDLLDGDDDVNGRIRGNGSGGITYSTAFTGQHPTSIVMNDNITTGMIVESTGEVWSKYTEYMETGIPKVTISTSENSKKVFGVVASLSGSFAGMVKASNQSEDETHIEVNSIGEGLVWVSNINGNIENGDYITSSDIYGIGQKQSDDILRSCTVAKCTENINWSEVTDIVQHDGVNYKKYLTTCTYHCG